MNTITLDGDSCDKKRIEIKEYFHNTSDLFETIFELLKDDETFYKKSEITRHPMIFYFGHTATFFINKLMSMNIIDTRIDPYFESVFAVGVDEMSWDDMNNQNYSWPKVKDVRIYRDKVKSLVDNLIDNMPLQLPIKEDSDMWVILMGIEHERIHLETSLVLHRQMPIEFIKNISKFNICDTSNKKLNNELLDIPSSNIKLGIYESHNLFSWDNEYGNYEKKVDNFKTSKFLVSNGEFLEFVENDGYGQKKYWDEEGKDFLNKTKAKYPAFWIKHNNTYKYRTLCSIIDMPFNFPAEVNALEAEAFCRYKSEKDNITYSLPSEVEYKSICKYAKLDDILDLDDNNVNQNLNNFSSCDVDIHSFNGIYDVIGNVWQWSRTPIFGFEGFKEHEAYDDFSIPTFDGKHSIINGSSWASSGNLISNSSRYGFRKHFYQNAGFRYVISNNKDIEKMDIYESDELVSQYCEFQYGDQNFGVKNFANECARIASKFTINKTKALDLGCATGRSSFELAQTFDKVDGIDFSARFIEVGTRLQNGENILFHSNEEGSLSIKKDIKLNHLGYEKIKDKVSFWQGDACNLKSSFNSYDLIMATNLIDRLYQPRLFLDTVSQRLNQDGILMLTSPYTWQESSTKKEFWLGGYKDENGNEVKTLDTLKNILSSNFELIHVEDLEFVIKETKRKYQHTVAEVTIWKKL